MDFRKNLSFVELFSSKARKDLVFRNRKGEGTSSYLFFRIAPPPAINFTGCEIERNDQALNAHYLIFMSANHTVS